MSVLCIFLQSLENASQGAVLTTKYLKHPVREIIFLFVGKSEVFYSKIDRWKSRGVLSAFVLGWKKEQLFRRTPRVAALDCQVTLSARIFYSHCEIVAL